MEMKRVLLRRVTANGKKAATQSAPPTRIRDESGAMAKKNVR
jgi:hypothetical protein